MATCQSELRAIIDAGNIGDITVLTPNQDFAITIGFGLNQLFQINTIEFNTATFTINIAATPPAPPVNVTVTFFQYDEITDTLINLGFAPITELSMEFQKDLSPGQYFICIASGLYTFTGTFRGDFISSPVTQVFFPDAYAGEEVEATITIERPPRDCDLPIYFELIEGSLPPGLEMNILGNIEGVLPNMDCQDETADVSPSNIWWYTLEGATYEPWGWQYRFKVRAWIDGFEEKAIEDWFCIRVHNNWSWDKQNFLDQIPVTYTEEEITETIETLPDLCCEPEAEPEPFVPEPIPTELCPCPIDDTPTAQIAFLEFYNSTQNKTDLSPYEQAFVDNFRNSDYFKELMAQTGIPESDLLTFEEQEELTVQAFIENAEALLGEDGRNDDDIDAIMLKLKEELNSTLPVTALGLDGTYMQFDIEVP